jgi:hypothetical protein
MLNRILITIGIIIGIFLVGLVSDVIRVHVVKSKLERCLEEVIKKGAVLIDTPKQAKDKIKEEIKSYGISLTDDDITISPTLNKITITKSLSIKSYFAWVLGKKDLKLYVQKQASVSRKIQPITKLETIYLGIIRPKGINFGFLYKLAKEPRTSLLEEKLVCLDFEFEFSKTLQVGNILRLRTLKEGELEALATLFMNACKRNCNINNFYHRCPKLLKIPVVERFKPLPSMVKVVGFACFFITLADDEKIMGYFIEHYQHGISNSRVSIDFGLRTRSKVEVRINHK